MSIFIKEMFYTLYTMLHVLKCRSFLNLPSYKENINGKCAVIGAGPSLKETLLISGNLLDDIPKMCVNNMVESNEYESLKPKYYVLLDPGYFSDNISDSLRESKDKFVDAMISKTKWNMILYLPWHSRGNKELQKISSNNSLIQIVYFNSNIVRGFRMFKFLLFKKNLGMIQAQNVLVAALFIALNIGYKEIYLLGADHSWHENIVLNEDNQVCVKQIHYYDDNKLVVHRPIYKNSEETETFKMNELFTAWSLVFKGYYDLKQYALHLNARIINISTKTYIDAFERIDLKK